MNTAARLTGCHRRRESASTQRIHFCTEHRHPVCINLAAQASEPRLNTMLCQSRHHKNAESRRLSLQRKYETQPTWDLDSYPLQPPPAHVLHHGVPTSGGNPAINDAYADAGYPHSTSPPDEVARRATAFHAIPAWLAPTTVLLLLQLCRGRQMYEIPPTTTTETSPRLGAVVHHHQQQRPPPGRTTRAPAVALTATP